MQFAYFMPFSTQFCQKWFLSFFFIWEIWIAEENFEIRRTATNLSLSFDCSSFFLAMGIFLSLFIYLISYLPVILARDVTHVTIFVDATKTVATIDEHFICATVDWWPHDKCNYNHCPWGNSSVINLVRLGKSYFFFSDSIQLSYDLIAPCNLVFSGLISSFARQCNPRFGKIKVWWQSLWYLLAS